MFQDESSREKTSGKMPTESVQNPYTTAVTQAAQQEMLRNTLEGRQAFYNMSIVEKTRARQNRCSRIGVSEMHREDRRQLAEGLADLVETTGSYSGSNMQFNEERVAGELLPPSFRPMRREGTKVFLERQKAIARVRMAISMKEREIANLQAQLARREEKLEADEISLNRLEISLETCTRSSDTGLVETTRQAELAAHKFELCKRRFDELSTALQTIFREIDRQADLLELNLSARKFLEDVASNSTLRSRVQEIQAERLAAEQDLATAVKEAQEKHAATRVASTTPDPYELLKTRDVLTASLEFCTLRASLLAAAGLNYSKLTERDFASEVEASQLTVGQSLLGETSRKRRERRQRQEESRRHLQVDFDFNEFQASISDGLPKDLFRYTPPLIEELQNLRIEEIRRALDALEIRDCSSQAQNVYQNAHLDAIDRLDTGLDITLGDISTPLDQPTTTPSQKDADEDDDDVEYYKSVRIFETLPVEHFPTDPSIRRAVLLLRRSCTPTNVPFQDAADLMGALKRLEDANLLRAEQLQDYASIVTNVQMDNTLRTAEFAAQQAALRNTITSMENRIAELKKSLETETANSVESEVDHLESELEYLHQAVSLAGMRSGAIGSDDINMASHSILGAMELLLDRTLAALAQIPVDRFQEGRRKLNKLRRDISKNAKQAEQDRLQMERNAKIALRAEKNAQARAPGRTVQFRSYGGQEKRMTRAQRELAARLSREDKTTGDNHDFYSRDI